MSRSLRGAALSAALLALAAPAAATDVPDSFSVNSYLQVTGLNVSVSYGAVDVGGPASPMQQVDALVSSNGSWSANISGSDFTGAGTLPKSVRKALLSSSNGSVQFDAGPTWRDFGAGGSLDDPEADVSGPAGSNLLVRSELRIQVPAGADAPAGAYSGSISYSFTAV